MSPFLVPLKVVGGGHPTRPCNLPAWTAICTSTAPQKPQSWVPTSAGHRGFQPQDIPNMLHGTPPLALLEHLLHSLFQVLGGHAQWCSRMTPGGVWRILGVPGSNPGQLCARHMGYSPKHPALGPNALALRVSEVSIVLPVGAKEGGWSEIRAYLRPDPQHCLVLEACQSKS